jgi:hypothetical protein
MVWPLRLLRQLIPFGVLQVGYDVMQSRQRRASNSIERPVRVRWNQVVAENVVAVATWEDAG